MSFFNNNIRKKFLKFLAVAAVLSALRFVESGYFSFALCFGFFVSSLFCGAGLLPASLAYGLSGTFCGRTLFFWTIVSLAVVDLLVFGVRLAKKKATKKLFFALLFLGQIFFLVYETAAAEVAIKKAVAFLAAFVFAAVSFFTIKSVVIRGLKYKLNTDEKICLSVFIVCVATGLANVNPYGLPVLRLAAPFAMLVSLYVFGDFTAIMTSVLLGAGSAFGSGSVTDVAVFALWAVAAVSFKSIKPFCVLSVPLTDFIVKYFFEVSSVTVLASAAVISGCLAFLCLPASCLERWSDKMGRNGEKYAVRSIVNRTKSDLSRKLYDLSEIFFEMKLSFLSMVKGVMPHDKAKIMLAREVSENVCRDCQERNVCWRTHMEKTESAFINMMDGAMDRGKATVLDLPTSMTQRCKRLNAVLSAVNQSVEQYKHYYTVTTNNDNSRLLIGEQLAGVSNIMKNLSEISKMQSKFDTEKERLLFEKLTYEGILIKEAVVSADDERESVTLVVETNYGKKEKVGEIVSQVCGKKMMLCETQATPNKNWIVLTFVEAPKYDVIFGFSGIKKSGSEVSGDTHTFLRIDERRFLLGLCDGMGSGEVAERASSTSISLIENFYKAGFDNETILTSVNKLLSLSQEEVFTAVDITVMNLEEGICDFIKIGAPCGFVKSRDNVEIVSAGALPLGVLEEMKPCITKKALSDGDMVIMTSDGITDAFGGKENLAIEISDQIMKTPQEMADIILGDAVKKNGGCPEDDMTVIVAQIFEKDSKLN